MTQSSFDKLAGIETVSRDVQLTQNLISMSSRQQQTYLEQITGQNSRQGQHIQDIAHTLQGLVSHLGISDDVGLRRPGTQARTFHRLMDKPSKTREIYDALGGRDGIQGSSFDLVSQAQVAQINPGNGAIYPVCICNKVQHRTNFFSVATTGAFVWRNEKMHHGHWPSCPLAGMANGEHRRVYGVKYNGLAWMLKFAVEVSFSSSHGAGGWSLSPHISFRPTVDEHTDPVFRILGLLREAVIALLEEQRLGIRTRASVEFISECQARILGLFQDKKTTHLATNSRNKTFAHELAEITFILRLVWVSTYS